MTVTAQRPSIEQARAQYAAKVRAEFTPAVPGLPGDGSPVVLHHDTDRDLTYTWYDRSPDLADASPRESGIETSLLTVTHGEHRVAYLRVSFTSRAIMDATFRDPFHFAHENTGATFAFHVRGEADPARLWATAHDSLKVDPASWNGTRPRLACSWMITPADAPTDPDVLAADLDVVAGIYRQQMRGFLRAHKTPFVAYSHVDDEFDAQRGAEGHPGPLRRTGVGRAMYVLAAQHLATTDRVLRASSMRTPEATALWDRLVADPTVPTRRSRSTYYRTGKSTTSWVIDYTRA